MFEPLSIGATYLGYAVLAGHARPTSAISLEARQVYEAASEVIRDREGSESLFGKKSRAISRLRTVLLSVTSDDEQEVVHPATVLNAEQFLLALPDDLPAPLLSGDNAIAGCIKMMFLMWSITLTSLAKIV